MLHTEAGYLQHEDCGMADLDAAASLSTQTQIIHLFLLSGACHTGGTGASLSGLLNRGVPS